jgi:hypothetical protein
MNVDDQKLDEAILRAVTARKRPWTTPAVILGAPDETAKQNYFNEIVTVNGSAYGPS